MDVATVPGLPDSVECLFVALVAGKSAPELARLYLVEIDQVLDFGPVTRLFVEQPARLDAPTGVTQGGSLNAPADDGPATSQ